MAEKKSIYFGNAKQITLQSGAIGMSLFLNVAQLSEAIRKTRENEDEAGNARWVSNQGNEYIRVSVFPLKPENVQEGKQTHSVKLDTWKKPENQTTQPQQAAPAPEPIPTMPEDQPGDDLPF